MFMGKLGKQLESDFDSVKKLFGKKLSYKQMYEIRLKEKKKEQEEIEYKTKLEALDAKESKISKVIRQFRRQF